MSNYTLKDVIIDPEDPRLEDAIGKEVYYSDYPNACVRYANDNNRLFIDNLASIHAEDDSPFSVKNCFCTCIIVKKEEPKPEFVPFDTIEEFVKASIEHNKDHYLAGTGIWIKKETYNDAGDEYCFVMVNGCSEYDEQISISDNTWMTFKEVFDGYTFLDDTPCGKLKEADNG